MNEYINRIVSPQIGIIPWVNEASVQSIYACGCYQYSAQTGNFSELHPELKTKISQNHNVIRGSGCADSAELSITKSVFETLERYAATVYSPNETVRLTPQEAEKYGFFISELPTLFLNERGHWRAKLPVADRQMRWIPAVNMITKTKIFVPLVLAHIQVTPEDNEMFWPQNSCGLAAHRTLEEATINCLYELIERDAAESVWLTRSEIPRIEIDETDSEVLRNYLWEDSSECIEQLYFDATSDIGVPTVYAVRLLSPPIGSDIIISCAADKNFESAIIKARQEAYGRQIANLHQTRGALYSRYDDAAGASASHRRVTREDISFLLKKNYCKKLSDINTRNRWVHGSICSEIGTLIKAISLKHREIYIVNLTTKDLQILGVHVIRIIIPTLLPTSPSSSQKLLKKSRIMDSARHYGNHLFDYSNLNLSESPFF